MAALWMMISVMPVPPRRALSSAVLDSVYYRFVCFLLFLINFVYVVEIRGHVGEKDGHVNPISRLIIVIKLECGL